MILEFFLIAQEPGAGSRMCAIRGKSETIAIAKPPLFTGADPERVRAVTKRTWLIVGGSHSTPDVVLTLKPDARTRVAATSASALGRSLAIVLDGAILNEPPRSKLRGIRKGAPAPMPVGGTSAFCLRKSACPRGEPRAVVSVPS